MPPKLIDKQLASIRRKTAIKRAFTRPFFLLFRPWVAGPKLKQAIHATRALNRRGGIGLINYLGEHYVDPESVKRTREEYLKMVKTLVEEKRQDPHFKAVISIKPTQFGFDVPSEYINGQDPQEYAFNNIREVVKAARGQGIKVEMDMEHSHATDFTLSTYKKLQEEFGGMRVCLQANLKRSEKDLAALVAHGRQIRKKPAIRLVKGIYPEKNNPEALHSEREIIENFKKLLKQAFSYSDIDIAIGTHRQDIIALADEASKLRKHPYTLQMLRGIRPLFASQLLKQKHTLAKYIPYGPDAVAYSGRRFKKGLQWTLGPVWNKLKRKPQVDAEEKQG